jgi:hypothetical protein
LISSVFGLWAVDSKEFLKMFRDEKRFSFCWLNWKWLQTVFVFEFEIVDEIDHSSTLLEICFYLYHWLQWKNEHSPQHSLFVVQSPS